jgi:intracellular multiplication protein IcmK
MVYTLPAFFILLLLLSFSSWAQNNDDPSAIPPEVIQHSDNAKGLDQVSTEQLRELIFKDLIEKRSLLTEEQLRQLHALERTQINATKRDAPPTGIKEVIPMSFDPAFPTAKIYVTPGWSTHISIIDQSGKPWSISYFSNGNQLDFTVKHIAVGSNNAMEVESIYTKGSTNLTLLLEGENDLFTLEIIATEDKFHPLATIRVNRYQDQADIQDAERRPSVSESLLREVLHGQITDDDNLESLISSDMRVKAWIKDEYVYIRTNNLRLLAPSAVSVEHGAGSVVAYKAPYLPAISLTNDNGNLITVTLEKER